MVSCYLAQLSLCPQQCLRETQSSLQSRKQIFDEPLIIVRENKMLSTELFLSGPSGIGVLGCVATGLAGTGVLGSEDKLSVSFFNSMPMGIRSGELSFPLTCSNSCTYIKEIGSAVIKWKSHSNMMACSPQQGIWKSFLLNYM